MTMLPYRRSAKSFLVIALALASGGLALAESGNSQDQGSPALTPPAQIQDQPLVDAVAASPAAAPIKPAAAVPPKPAAAPKSQVRPASKPATGTGIHHQKKSRALNQAQQNCPFGATHCSPAATGVVAKGATGARPQQNFYAKLQPVPAVGAPIPVPEPAASTTTPSFSLWNWLTSPSAQTKQDLQWSGGFGLEALLFAIMGGPISLGLGLSFLGFMGVVIAFGYFLSHFASPVAPPSAPSAPTSPATPAAPAAPATAGAGTDPNAPPAGGNTGDGSAAASSTSTSGSAQSGDGGGGNDEESDN